MQTLYRIEKEIGKMPRAVFCVTTDRGKAFLCTDSTWENHSIVEVDTRFFLELWRADTYQAHKTIAQGSPETWAHDDKFKHAEAGFSCGESNPVPLAYINCEIRDEEMDVWERYFIFFRRFKGRKVVSRIPYITFTDGITRTIWLMTRNAPYFPVLCDTKDAALLQVLAGLPEGKPQTMPELLGLEYKHS